MKTLADAWEWYESTRRSLEQIQRIGRRYWPLIPWNEEPLIGRDDVFRTLDARDIEKATASSLAPIDDLAIVVLFSVFESLVREHLVESIRPEAASMIDPILKDAAEDAIRGVQEGSFYNKVLEPLKSQGRVSADLVTQVNQVRDYRNWVAHGRRDAPDNVVSPLASYDRLKRFLDALGIATESEKSSTDVHE